jgi:hypothetical protein
MSQALQTPSLNADAAAFLSAGAANPKPTLVRESAPLVAKPVPEPAPEVALAESPRPEVARPMKKPPREKQADFPGAVGLVSMTFRLPAEIPAGLIRASADRRLRRETPSSQQEIVAEALMQWLSKHDYLT